MSHFMELKQFKECLPPYEDRDDGVRSLVEGLSMGQMFSHLEFP